jgi:hypothetical protein
MKLDSGHTNILRLVAKEQQNPSGWAPCSRAVYPLVKGLPQELVEHQELEEGKARVRLTEKGQSVMAAMEYFK